MTRLAFLLIVALIVAACGGSPTPTATPTPAPTETPIPDTAGGEPIPTRGFEALQVTIPVAQPGTPISPSLAGTVQPANAAPFRFDRLFFAQTGGIAAMELTIEVFADGRVIRNGVESRTSAETVANLTALLEAFDVFRVAGQFMGLSASADAYTYAITIDAGGSSRTIMSQDGYTPPELFAIYDAVRALGQ